jgi:flavin reductase (DIM6/NTAB) family NADH-FMN oxidoreductase RutF
MPADPISDLFAQLDRELWVVTAAAGERRGGLIATFVSAASIVPAAPRALVGLSRQHQTWELVEASGAFALHLLRPEQLEWVWRFGTQSGREVDKFAGLPFQAGATGSPILPDALGWLDCRVEARLETGDRTVYLAEVLDGRFDRGARPLTTQQLRQLAPADKLAVLKQQLAHDSRLDEAAIQAWRLGGSA